MYWSYRGLAPRRAIAVLFAASLFLLSVHFRLTNTHGTAHRMLKPFQAVTSLSPLPESPPVLPPPPPSTLSLATTQAMHASNERHSKPALTMAKHTQEVSITSMPTPAATEAEDNFRTSPFPVVLLAHARARRLNVTLHSLLAVRGIDAQKIFVLQDGDDAMVSQVVHSSGVKLSKLPAHGPRTANPADDKSGGTIARAYKTALTHAFDKLTDDEALLVVEDDLLFSPDLMEYFLAAYHVMRSDASLWIASAWNDNGFRGMVGGVDGSKRLLRTGFFPGLGWLLTRRLYKKELEAGWPSEHWDHWMRSETVYKTSKGRECLFPQVPRTFHHGAKGTFMNPALHARFFAHVAHSTDPRVRWPTVEWRGLRESLSRPAYEARLRDDLKRAEPLTDLSALVNGTAKGWWERPHEEASLAAPPSATSAANGAAAAGRLVSLWYSEPQRGHLTLFRDLALLFGLWHEMRRSAHNGVHEFRCGASYVLLVNTLHGPYAKKSPYVDLAPDDEHIFRSSDALRKAVRRAFRSHPDRSQTAICRDMTQPMREVEGCRGYNRARGC